MIIMFIINRLEMCQVDENLCMLPGNLFFELRLREKYGKYP